MQSGSKVANQMMAVISDLTAVVAKQANKFPQLAQAIEERDQADARKW
jgi:hypothetical protein